MILTETESNSIGRGEVLGEDLIRRDSVNDHVENTETAETGDVTVEEDTETESTDVSIRAEIPGIIASMTRLGNKNMRLKPVYSDCWLIGERKSLDYIDGYEITSGDVVIGSTFDGQIEYNLLPREYTFDPQTNNIIGNTIERLRTDFLKGSDAPNRQNILNRARSIMMGSIGHFDTVASGDAGMMEMMLTETSDAVYRHTMGLGIFDILLSDPRIEDVYIDAPCDRNRVHVTLNGVNGFNSHLRCRTNLMVDRREVQNLISSLKRESGLPFCESSPVLETDLHEHDARVTVVGYPMSPNGDAVAIRKHSTRPWTLTRLVANGTIDAEVAGLLSFLIDARSTFLICGARGSGKSSLLSALMFEFPLSQRILTIEDTMELPCETMRRMGYKVQAMLIDDRMNGDALKRSDEALRVSLRLGESAIVLGEVRGEEAKTLYQSMRTGKAGSSILGTIHGDSAQSVYERVVHDMNIAPEAFMATDVIVTMGTRRTKGTSDQKRLMSEMVSTGNDPGDFVEIMDAEGLTDAFFETPMMRRIMGTTTMTQAEIIREVGIRSEVRRFLVEMSETDEIYSGPEWVTLSNDFISRESSAENAVEKFKEWFGRYNGLS